MAGQKDFYKKGDQISGSEHKEPQGSHSARPLLLLLVGRQVALDPPLHVHVFAGFWGPDASQECLRKPNTGPKTRFWRLQGSQNLLKIEFIKY